jgi:shikimate dehydrogenase
MRKFGLIGYPLGHSFSKKYFSEKFLAENITGCSYENYPLTDPGQLKMLLAKEPELVGLNVTIPYKSEILRYIDILDPEAQEIGAVNVLKIKRRDGNFEISGFNSDITGIEDSLSPYTGSIIKNAIVFGTGGSSRAVCYVLGKLGIGATVVSRTKRPGYIGYDGVDRDLIEKTGLLVNTTPLGMFPDVDARPEFDYTLLGEKHVLFDLVYNPEYTLFLRSGKKQGCRVITGLKMLRSQAEKAWQIWNDETL